MIKSFSVLLSVYSREQPAYLIQCFNSIFSQSIKPGEIVLVKDGILTNELNHVISIFLSEHPEIKIVELEKNKGLGNALNKGLKYCTNDLVARRDTDNIAKSDRFEKQLAVFNKYPQVEVVSS